MKRDEKLDAGERGSEQGVRGVPKEEKRKRKKKGEKRKKKEKTPRKRTNAADDSAAVSLGSVVHGAQSARDPLTFQVFRKKNFVV